MSDLSVTQAAATVKLIGSDSSGVTTNPVTVTTSGAIHTVPPIVNTGFTFGQLFTTAASPSTGEKVLRTAYTEQATDAQRSIKSASANDTSAGSGARTVKITYLDQTYAGPYTDTITLNGTSWVNTNASNICFIEKVETVTVGSGKTNAGILTINTAIDGGGSAFVTITAGDNSTRWAQHYIPTGKTCYLSDWHAANELNAATAGAITWLAATPSGSYERLITGKLRYIGNIGTMAITYLTPIKIVGPARINAYVVSESTADNEHHAEFSYFEL
jgi:hypothetical protein